VRAFGKVRPPALVALAWVAALAALGLASGEARAEVQPLRVDYEAHEGCAAGDVFLGEVLARTSRARAAADGEPALEVRVRITRHEPKSVGRLVLWKSSGARAREVESDDCGDVVSALALITALALDPDAASQPRPAASASPAAPPPEPAAPPSSPPAPDAWAMPVAPIPAPRPAQPPRLRPPPAPPAALPRVWVVGAHASAAFAVTPRPLLGGGLFAERLWGGVRGVSARLGLELATTGSFDAGPGGVTFLRGAARLEGCPFFRPRQWLALGACLGAEVGFLRGEGLRRGALASVEAATVPWAGLGLLPRAAIGVGERAVVGVGVGPTFPLVRRAFVFERPDYTIHAVPDVTWTARLEAGVRF
jgi:hypothetical protein